MFLYEMVWDLGLFAVLYWLGSRRKVRAPGLFWLYVAGYSAFRIFAETQRTDYANYFLGMRVNFWVATVLCSVALVCCALIQRGFRGWGTQPAAPAPPGTRYGPHPKTAPQSHLSSQGALTQTAPAIVASAPRTARRPRPPRNTRPEP